jgi:hypothetical protein
VHGGATMQDWRRAQECLGEARHASSCGVSSEVLCIEDREGEFCHVLPAVTMLASIEGQALILCTCAGM